jgi:hypothetical protein
MANDGLEPARELRNRQKRRAVLPSAGSRFCRAQPVGLTNLRLPAYLLSLLLLAADPSPAQTPLSNAVFTVGTTVRDASNLEWSYVLLNSPDAAAVAGRRFAVFGKPGNASSANLFTRRGTLAPQTELAPINTLLNQSVALGESLDSLNDAFARLLGTNVVGLLSHVPGILGQPLPQRVLTALQLASADPELAESLALLANGHPGMNLCLGRAFAEQINSVTTYELRELDPVSGAAGDVVGRVTVTPGAPVMLPAPGRPFQVVTNDPSDHLRVRLRWGSPPELRRLALLQSGFNLWRIPRAPAEAANFHITPPTINQLYSNPNFSRANPGPVVPPLEMDLGAGPGGAEYAADRIHYFFADNGRSTGVTFVDGQEFYYFVTARDLLGRDGLVSAGGLARACRRVPPEQPTDVRVENTVLPGSTNLPRLLVKWQQNLNPTNAVTHYWIYRWLNPSAALTNDPVPFKSRIAVVTQAPGTNENSFLDNTPGALTAPNLSNVWYTVRAVSEAACDSLFSPHSAPAWGVLRQRDGPVATTGEVVGSCGTPVVMFQNFLTNTINSDTQNIHLRLTCVRRDPGIAWVQFNVTNVNSFEERVFGPVYFPPDGDTVQLDYDSPAYITSQTRQIYLGCFVGTADDRVSQIANCVFTTPFPSTQQREAVFLAGQLLATALSSSDPLLLALNGGGSQCLPGNNVTPDASGMVSMTFDYNDAPTVLVQALSSNVWLDVAVVSPDSNRVYWVSYPACLIGPVPPFRGCRVNFPPGGGDCDQHVAAGAVGGAIAPIRVRFRLVPRTREYRVYRRVDEGPLTLLAQGAALYDPAKANKLIESVDEALPPSSARLCYFVQLLDEHGNGSPLAFIGCKSVKPAKLPRPVLAEPLQTGDANNPQVVLNWFCPTAGVSRFQFKIAVVDAESPSKPSGIVSSQLRIYPAYNRTVGFMGLTKNALKIVSFSEAHFTPNIGAGFGPGPQFTISASVSPKATYDICVTPVDEQGKVRHESTSEVWRFKWTPPVQVATVPWPARPLPPVRSFEPDYVDGDLLQRVEAKSFVTYYNGIEDRRRPAGVRIGEIDSSFSIHSGWVGDTNVITYNHANSIVNPDPHHGLFRSKSIEATLANRPVLPMVLYRQQVTNASFPKVSGDVVQVSPLIERIPWSYNANLRTVTIPDRLLRIHGETYNDHSYYFLYVCDQQPLLLGARYRYFIVHFNDQREAADIIPAGEAELPLNPFNGP